MSGLIWGKAGEGKVPFGEGMRPLGGSSKATPLGAGVFILIPLGNICSKALQWLLRTHMVTCCVTLARSRNGEMSLQCNCMCGYVSHCTCGAVCGGEEISHLTAFTEQGETGHTLSPEGLRKLTHSLSGSFDGDGRRAGF